MIILIQGFACFKSETLLMTFLQNYTFVKFQHNDNDVHVSFFLSLAEYMTLTCSVNS